MTPKAVPAAPFGLLARQCHADADVDAAAAIVAPTNNAMRSRLMIAPPDVIHEIIITHLTAPLQGNSPVVGWHHVMICPILCSPLPFQLSARAIALANTRISPPLKGRSGRDRSPLLANRDANDPTATSAARRPETEVRRGHFQYAILNSDDVPFSAARKRRWILT
jgi:hypothetical protein